jgi:hypothetical protein
MLARIPHIEGGTIGLLRTQADAARLLLAEARRMYPARAIHIADRITQDWLRRAGNPYLAELETLAGILGEPGIYMLNASYEWGCTTAVGPAPGGRWGRMLRTLDWPMNGLGRAAAVLKTRGPAGEYLSVTWPGYAGVLTAMAPRRFSLAINQAKDWHGRFTRLLEWPLTKLRMLRSDALPPDHLSRRVCEEARDYASAVRMLAETPVCMPAFFSVGGLGADEGCLIERTPDGARIHAGPIACGNHWRFPGLRGEAPSAAMRLDSTSRYMRGSRARHDAMVERMHTSGDGFDWLTPPILCPDTKLACIAEAASGRLEVVGVERMAQACSYSAFRS